MSFKNVLMLRQGPDESKEDDLMWGDYRRNLKIMGLREVVWVIFDHFTGPATCTSVS
jgi:hypothetical protein